MEKRIPANGRVDQSGSKVPISVAVDSNPPPPAKTAAGKVSVMDDIKTRLRNFIIFNVFRPG